MKYESKYESVERRQSYAYSCSPWNLNWTLVTENAQFWPLFKRNHLVTDKHVLHNWKHIWNSWLHTHFQMMFCCLQPKQTVVIVHKCKWGVLLGKKMAHCSTFCSQSGTSFFFSKYRNSMHERHNSLWQK